MIPTDTIRPVTPDRSRVRSSAEWPRAETMAHSSAAVVSEAGDHHDPEHPVVEDRVEQHQQQPADARRASPALSDDLPSVGDTVSWVDG